MFWFCFFPPSLFTVSRPNSWVFSRFCDLHYFCCWEERWRMWEDTVGTAWMSFPQRGTEPGSSSTDVLLSASAQVTNEFLSWEYMTPAGSLHNQTPRWWKYRFVLLRALMEEVLFRKSAKWQAHGLDWRNAVEVFSVRCNENWQTCLSYQWIYRDFFFLHVSINFCFFIGIFLF